MFDQYVYEEGPELCEFCGSESAYFVLETDDDEVGKYHCANCGSQYRYVGTEYRDEGERVVLKGGKRDWLKHLNENLSFPFEGYILDEEYGWPFRQNDVVIVNGIVSENVDYGLMASINPVNKRHSLLGKKKHSYPIADIRAADENSKNYKELDGYSVWFCNFRD